MDPKKTIKKNLERRSEVVDVTSLNKGLPNPTWVELSLIDVCNRKCIFCPKSNENIAPDTYQKMSRKIIDEIHNIRESNDNSNKLVATHLYNLVKNVNSMKLVLIFIHQLIQIIKEEQKLQKNESLWMKFG